MDVICHSAEYLHLPLKHGNAHHLAGAHLHVVLKVFLYWTAVIQTQQLICIQQGIFLACADILLTV